MAYHTKQNHRQCTHKNWGDKALIRFLQEGSNYDYGTQNIKIFKNDEVIAGGLDEDGDDIRAIGISAILNLDLGDEVSSQSKYRLMHEKRDKSIIKNFISKKFRKWFYFFTCILPNYLIHKSQKEFWKNSHFENTRAGFLLRCQNSLWQNTSEIMHFQAWKNKDFIQYFVVAFDPIKIFTH